MNGIQCKSGNWENRAKTKTAVLTFWTTSDV